MPPDVDRMASAVIAIVKASRESLLEIIATQGARIKALESRAAIPGPPGPQGQAGERGATGANGTDGAEGRPADPVHVKAIVDAALAELPTPKNGERGQDGVSVDPVVVDAMIAAHVEVAVKAIPRPQDGKSVTVEEVTPLIESEVAKAVERRPVPKDGVGLTGALLDRSGHLVLTLSDGSTKDIGSVVGRDVDAADVERAVLAQLATWPRPAAGQDGRDGTLENLKVLFDGERTIRLCFKDSGDPIEGGVIRVPWPIDRGVFKPGTTYERGDGVTTDGSWFIAQRDTKPTERPEDASGAFRLSVKHGRPGKNGTDGAPGAKGSDGRHGRDLTTVIDPITGRRP